MRLLVEIGEGADVQRKDRVRYQGKHMPLILHAADLHIDSPLHHLDTAGDAPLHAMEDAVRRAVDRLIDLAVALPADLLLIAGDVFDGDWRDYHTGLWFAKRMARLGEAGVRAALVSGNHDAAGRMTRSLRLPGNMHVFDVKRPETVRYDDLGVAVHGRGFARAAVTENLAAGFPPALDGYFNIGLLHTALSGRPGHAPYAPCDINDLAARGYQYWALGHVHRREIVHVDPLVVYPGNIQGRHVREDGPKGCCSLRISGPHPPDPATDLRFHPLDVFRWGRASIDLSAAADGAAAADLIRTALPDRLSRLHESGGAKGWHRQSPPEPENDIPAALRLYLTGETLSHADLSGDPERWLAQIRADAADLSGGRLWITDLRLDTRLPAAAGDAVSGPLAEVRQIMAAAALPGATRDRLEARWREFRSRLPAEALMDAGLMPGTGDDHGGGDEFRSLLSRAEGLLRQRLRPEEEP
ncbi:MAG: DNA repair exonuclease [Desulfobacterales bacterium]|nr:MAG: DNA repair exonuclease [Desulfobacterales bacterium]